MPSNIRFLPLSYSSLRTYYDCPARFLHRQMNRSEPHSEGSDAMRRGSIIHAIMAEYVDLVRAGRGPSEQHLASWLEQRLLKAGTPAEVVKFRDSLTAYIEHIGGIVSELPAVETELRIAVDNNWNVCEWTDSNCLLRGAIDRIDFPEGEDGSVATVHDYKTGFAVPDPLQADVYALLAFLRYPDIEEITFLWNRPDRNYIKQHQTYYREEVLEERSIYEGIVRDIRRREKESDWNARGNIRCGTCPCRFDCEYETVPAIHDQTSAEAVARALIHHQQMVKDCKEQLKTWTAESGRVVVDNRCFEHVQKPPTIIIADIADFITHCSEGEFAVPAGKLVTLRKSKLVTERTDEYLAEDPDRGTRKEGRAAFTEYGMEAE